MSPREQNARPAQRSDRPAILADHRVRSLRPVALPALAAAVQASATARKRARAALMSTTRPARFEHEDTPLS